MEAFFLMLKNVALFVLLAVPGYLLIKSKQLKVSESGTLTKVLTHIGVPFMVLTNVLNMPLTGEAVLSIVEIGILSALFMLLLFFLSAFLTKGETKKRGMMRFCMIFSNNGFLGIPLAQAAFGNSLELSCVIMVNIVANILMFTLGIYLISGDKKQIHIKHVLVNPILIAFVLGIALNLLGVQKIVPITEYSSLFNSIITPLAMLILGIKMATIRLRDLFAKARMYYVSLIRLIISPVLGIILLKVVNVMLPITDGMLIGFFIAFACPTSGLATTFADQYDGDIENSVIYTLGSTLLSVISIPLLYGGLVTML